MQGPRIIISGGGTGGHVFPAIAIANELKVLRPDCKILFVGAKGRMEMEKVPEAGYEIIGLNISGLQRRLSLRNLSFPFKVIGSLIKSSAIIRQFKPQVAVGVGGYASGPLLYQASKKGIPCLVQEQNSFPGITNKLLAKRVQKICVAYDKMDRFFPKEKLIFTGNPVRSDVIKLEGKRERGFEHYKLDPSRKTILVVGGSLGARSINQGIAHNLKSFADAGIQVIWQTGRAYWERGQQEAEPFKDKGIWAVQFIKEMDYAYAAADMIISRAGAIAVSELCNVAKPVILIPSPNVAEDHQTKNALALVNHNAAIMVKDVEVKEKLWDEIQKLMADEERQRKLSENILQLAKADAAKNIAQEVLELIK